MVRLPAKLSQPPHSGNHQGPPSEGTAEPHTRPLKATNPATPREEAGAPEDSPSQAKPRSQTLDCG